MKEHATEMKGQVMESIASLITVAFGLIAALAWNEAISALIKQILGAGNGLTGLFTYAILITIIAVFATILIGRLIKTSTVQDVRIVE
ncbi:MAG: DUF5654 family protein [Methanobacteriaceae archaeon]